MSKRGEMMRYTAIVSPSGPCFVSPTGQITLTLGGIPVTLRNARVAATFNTTPATALSNGLLIGFLTEADADATISPAGVPLVGGQPLSRVLPGGTGNCAAVSDKDNLDGNTPGWWFYLNFPAARVEVDRFANGFVNGFE